jgi:hypothetical protein
VYSTVPFPGIVFSLEEVHHNFVLISSIAPPPSKAVSTTVQPPQTQPPVNPTRRLAMPLPDNHDSHGQGTGSAQASGEPSDPDDKVCRDFLRNVCHRGNKCRFRHPDGNELESLGSNRPESMFCHDYQNRACSRSNCKFIHCTREEQVCRVPIFVDQIINHLAFLPLYPFFHQTLPIKYS